MCHYFGAHAAGRMDSHTHANAHIPPTSMAPALLTFYPRNVCAPLGSHQLIGVAYQVLYFFPRQLTRK